MKMKTAIILGFFILFIAGCDIVDNCDSGLKTSEGKCCTYVCNLECANGYKEGTCNCECRDSSVSGNDGIDDLFDDSADIQPPMTPN